MMFFRKLSDVCLPAIVAAAFFVCACSSRPPAADANTEATSSTNIAEVNDARYAMALGDQYLENNQTDKAVDAYMRATELDPNLADAWFKLGIAYGLIEKEAELAAQNDVNAAEETRKEEKRESDKAFKKAVEAYKKILDQNVDDHAALFNLGRSYNKLNQDQDAAKALKQAVKLNPEDSEYQTELGAILIKLAQYHEAIPPLKKALELDPENLRAADLLEDAQAGRTRVDYAKTRSNGNSNASASSTANVNANSAVSSNANTAPANRPIKPPIETKLTPKPAKPTPKPNDLNN